MAYKHFIDSKDLLELLCLKLMFLGPPRQGKSTTRRRVTKEIIDLESANEANQVHGSTGTVKCCPNMLVEDNSDLNTTAEGGANWTIVQSPTEEACVLFQSLKNSLESGSISKAVSPSHKESASMAEVSQASSTEQSRPVKETPQPGFLQKFIAKINSLTQTRQSGQEHLSDPSSAHIRSAHERVNLPDYSEIATIFKEVSQQPEFMQNLRHSFKAYLRMEDTGGQPEMMDMLPALTIGPGLYLLFFSYEFKLDEEYQVFYQRDSGETTIPEKSEFTLQEMLLSTLASISCSSASTYFQPLEKTDNTDISKLLHESSKSVVYIVGTHKDRVEEDYIATVDDHLQKIIRDTDFYREDIVQFCSDDKLVVSLDNMGGGNKEIQRLHQLLESAMEKHFKKLKIPAVWLLFSLCLRMREVRTVTMDTCLTLSNALNMTRYETTVALWFLHHHAGVLMHFPTVAGLEDLVIIDNQVVFDSITGVILKAMRLDKVGRAAAERFRKTGQFTMKDLKSATADISGDVIPPDKLIALLAYLHITAEILSDNSSAACSVLGKEKMYIMPCVLESTCLEELDQFHKESQKTCIAAPLFVYFTCGFTPIGLFSGLMACIVSNKSFCIIREGIKKNMMQFLFEPKLTRVTFISRAKHLEVVVSCNSTFQSLIHHECTDLKKEIENAMKKVSFRMNYSSYMDYQFAFECCKHEGGNHLGLINKEEPLPKVMKCILNSDNPQPTVLQNRQLIWYGQEYEGHPIEISECGNFLSVFISLYPDLVSFVGPCVMAVADQCFSRQLISGDVYDQLNQRVDLINKDKARNLLSNIRTVIGSKPNSLKDFMTALFQVEYCHQVAEKMQQQLQVVIIKSNQTVPPSLTEYLESSTSGSSISDPPTANAI